MRPESQSSRHVSSHRCDRLCAGAGTDSARDFCFQARPRHVRFSGQLPEAAFDPNLVEFVAHPQPLLSPFTNEDVGLSFKVIARVVGVRPLVFEILDQEKLRDTYEALPPCELQRIYSVDARLRNVLPGLRFGDLVQARLMAAQGGIVPLILSEVEKIPGEPKYLHEPSRRAVVQAGQAR